MREERARKHVKSQMWKDMASLTDNAPKFDGSWEVTYWLSSMKRYFKRCQIEDSYLQREVLIGSLQGVV